MSKELTPLEALEKAKMDMNYHRKYECHYYYPKEEREEYFSIIETALNESNGIKSSLDFLYEEFNIKNFTDLQNKLKVLEIIKELLDLKFIERPDLDNTMYYAVVVRPKGYEPFGMVKKIGSKEEYDLLKEVLL